MMLKLTPEMEAEYATFWDGLGIRVADTGKTGIELRDKTNENLVLAFLPRSLYEYLTMNLIQTYQDDEPDFIRESIFQEGKLS
ncbi:hypothetical protein LQ938_09520 [Microbacterium sp. cx-55]|uniref:hypothetical protein n=1 Tax=Microbacterium sp. cx-55 TaxID=2875948 RepID=UPI001CBBD509|nr:hypothetical protein [Microbacterium sp. cx-55]MBZ4486000.1 hypothetical protein [Microbacterium sp. cx-55]UGB34127.1 hypothetical protein LQ938_09520 [Microbacterium sp. cx-55]